MMTRSKTRVDLLRRLVRGVIWVVVIVLALLFLPPATGNLVSQANPAGSYAEAILRIEILKAGEASGFNTACRTRIMTHGRKAKRVIVFFHGYTSCPQQYQALGEAFYDLGYNVLAVPLPHHGLIDRMTEEQARLTAEELAAYADEVIDIAQGLGEEVTLAGLSGGGVVVGWAAQQRNDIDLAVLISPAFGFGQIPTPLTLPATNLFRLLPNFYQWWQPDLKEAGGLAHSYPRYSSHALAQILRLSHATQVAARQKTPAARALLVITNANDTSVNNELTSQVVEQWRQHGVKDLRTYEFDAGLKLDHDLIDPAQPDQRIDIVYPQIIELVTNL